MQLPNTLGFLFGIIQMVLYLIYRNAEKGVKADPAKMQELNGHVIDVVKLSTMVPSDPNQVTKIGAMSDDPNDGK